MVRIANRKKRPERAEQLEMKAMLDEKREQAKDAGLTEQDIMKEIESYRRENGN